MIHGRERDSRAAAACTDHRFHDLQAIAHSVLFSSRSFKQRGAHYLQR